MTNRNRRTLTIRRKNRSTALERSVTHYWESGRVSGLLNSPNQKVLIQMVDDRSSIFRRAHLESNWLHFFWSSVSVLVLLSNHYLYFISVLNHDLFGCFVVVMHISVKIPSGGPITLCLWTSAGCTRVIPILAPTYNIFLTALRRWLYSDLLSLSLCVRFFVLLDFPLVF